MCGRFALTSELKEAAALFEVHTDEVAPPRYNIAPTQPISVIYQEFNNRHMNLMRWGFVPSWVKDPADFSLLINARSETVTTKPSFKSAIRHRRCIIPATGFYEWKREGKQKTAYFIKQREGEVIGYAGVYETYTSDNGSEIDTVCFLTTEASSDIAEIHHRMPVAISPAQADIWLDCVNNSPADVTFFYDNSKSDFYTIVPVSDRVNSARFDDADLQVEVQPDEKFREEEEQPASAQLQLF